MDWTLYPAWTKCPPELPSRERSSARAGSITGCRTPAGKPLRSAPTDPDPPSADVRTAHSARPPSKGTPWPARARTAVDRPSSPTTRCTPSCGAARAAVGRTDPARPDHPRQQAEGAEPLRREHLPGAGRARQARGVPRSRRTGPHRLRRPPGRPSPRCPPRCPGPSAALTAEHCFSLRRGFGGTGPCTGRSRRRGPAGEVRAPAREGQARGSGGAARRSRSVRSIRRVALVATGGRSSRASRREVERWIGPLTW